jgi:hypothetical protein
VLADGEIVGTWRARTAGERLRVEVEPFGRLNRTFPTAIEAEADRVALVRGADSSKTSFESP